MSRPPLHRASPSPRGIDSAAGQNRYFGLRFAELVALAESLAKDAEGVAAPGGERLLAQGIVEIPGKDRGLARTLLEIPALFAHILGEHQSHYAGEAFISTAQRPESLVAHGRRLAYTPDPGVAATGLAAFKVKAGLSGEVPRHFALQSEPKGEVKSQSYETLESVHVDAAWNAIRPVAASVETPLIFVDDLMTLPLTAPHGMSMGDVVLLQGQSRQTVCEVADANLNGAIVLRRLSGRSGGSEAWPAYRTDDPYRILARPTVKVRAFGWNADPLTFPPEELKKTTRYDAPDPDDDGRERFGYQVSGLPSNSYVAADTLLLAEPVQTPAVGSPVAVVHGSLSMVYLLAKAREATVSFLAGERISIPQPEPPLDGYPPNQLIERAISGRVTLLDLQLGNGASARWENSLPIGATVYMGWSEQIDIAPTVANTSVMASTVALRADLSAMRPGRRLLLEKVSNGYTATATVTKVMEPTTEAGGWQVVLGLGGGSSASQFTLGDVVVRGNAVQVSHGETKAEDIGGSDGVSAHQTFSLKNTPLTRLPGVDGAEMALEIRVNGVLWGLVEDFHAVPAEGRAARVSLDAEQGVSVAFGGEGRGAVPPAGRRNITAQYRVGLGGIGDAEAGRLTRIRKSLPILETVSNPLALTGGTDPASAADMRRQATRPILTFDRAVSVQDHADLALLFPGVARAAARWLNRGAVELIAADAAGEPPSDSAALRAYMNARRDEQVPLILLRPQAVDVALKLRVERDQAWLADAVRLGVAEALIGDDAAAPGLFTFAAREFSAPQSLSGLYQLLLEVPGVTGVEALRYAIAPDNGVADILHATARQWLRLLPTELVIDVAEPSSLIPDIEEMVS